MSLEQQIEKRTNGCNLVGEQFGSVVALILCKRTEKKKSGLYLTWQPKSVYEFKGEPRLSGNFFPENSEDLSKAIAFAHQFITTWRYKEWEAIDYVRELEEDQKAAGAWRKEIAAEREAYIAALKQLEKPDNLNVDPGVPTSLLGAQ